MWFGDASPKAGCASPSSVGGGHDLSANKSRSANGAPALASEVPPWRGLAASPLGFYGGMGATGVRAVAKRATPLSLSAPMPEARAGLARTGRLFDPSAPERRAHQVAVVVVVEQA